MTTVAAIHVAKRDLGIEENDYRSLLHLVTGKSSLRQMNSAEQSRVLDALGARGARKKEPLPGPYGAKLQALWLSGWNLDLIRNATDEALLAFVREQTKIDHTRFLRDAADARKAVEALKKWLQRGGVNWSTSEDPKDCVIAAQLKLLGDGERVRALAGVRAWLAGQADDKAKVALMKRLGTRLRSRNCTGG